MTVGCSLGLVDPQENVVRNGEFMVPLIPWSSVGTNPTNWTRFANANTCLNGCTTLVSNYATWPTCAIGTSSTTPWSQFMFVATYQWIATTLSGLTVGTTYRISFRAAMSLTYAGTITCSVLIDAVTIYTTALLPRQKPLQFYSINWVATAATVTLQFNANVISGGGARMHIARVQVSPIHTVVSSTS